MLVGCFSGKSGKRSRPQFRKEMSKSKLFCCFTFGKVRVVFISDSLTLRSNGASSSDSPSEDMTSPTFRLRSTAAEDRPEDGGEESDEDDPPEVEAARMRADSPRGSSMALKGKKRERNGECWLVEFEGMYIFVV